MVDGKVIRYLNEIVEFSANEPTTVFKQKFINGKFVIENGSLSEDFKEKMAEKFITFEFPEDQTNTEESLPEEEEVI